MIKGKKLNKNAIEFFDKLGQHESTNNYSLVNSYGYMGRYQVGTDIMGDLDWYNSSEGYIGEAKKKWRIKNRKDFLKNPAAQDDLIMKSMFERWKHLDGYLKKYAKKGIMDFVCKEITVSPDAVYTNTSGIPKNRENILKVLENKKNKKLGDPRGKKFLITISGLLAGTHLTGQGGMGIFLTSNGKKIPTDGNGTMVLFYMEELKGHDLSMLCNHKDNCNINDKVVVKNDSFKDKVILKEEMSKGTNKTSSINTPEEVPKKEESGIYEFKGQKFEEVWDSEFYKQDITMRKQVPIAGYVEPGEAVIKRLEDKFKYTDIYNMNYIKYIESKTGKKVLDENKEEISIMLSLYDNATKAGKKSGNIIRQYGFNILRGRNEITEPLRIQDIAYYMYYYPIPKKGQLETLEYIFSKFSGKYLKFPDVRYTKNKKTGEYQIPQIAEFIKNFGKRIEEPVIKYNLPVKYDKYMEGIKDIDEIILHIPKKEKQDFNKMRSENLLRGLEMAKEHKKSYSVDENGVRKYPLARRFLDNLLMEFIKVETGFKGEKEEKYYDGHKYKDSNILRNYLLWYDENFGRIELPHPEGKGMYAKLEKLGKDLRITTILDIWINFKEKNKLKHIRKIHNLVIDNYGDYTDAKTTDRDKEIIKGHFSDIKELRDYAADRDSMNLYSFYREFYSLKNIINPTNELYVNENCILKCTLGEGMSRIKIGRDSIMLRGAKQANIKDKNILPFRSCKAASSCKPELLDMWEKNTETQIGGGAALLDISTIKCKYGGIISIDDSGQRKVKTSSNSSMSSTGNKTGSSGKTKNSNNSLVGTAKTETINVKQSKKEVNCSYRSFLDICVAINKNFMQTLLKKECQNYKRYKKDSSDLEKKRRGLYGEINKAKKEFIRPGDYFGEKLKNERVKNAQKKYETFLEKNREKIVISRRETSITNKLKLVSKILIAMNEANIKAENMSVPKKDIKEVFKNYFYTACDYDKKNFYRSNIFGSIVYGYLSAAMGEKADKKTQKEIEKEVKKKMEEENRKNNAYPNYKMTGYETYDVIQKKEAEKREKVKIKVETQIPMIIGEELYEETKEVPTGNLILSKIRAKIKPVIKCPFSEVERQEKHGEKNPFNSKEKEGNSSGNKTNNDNKNSVPKNIPTDSSNIGTGQNSLGSNKTGQNEKTGTKVKEKQEEKAKNDTVLCSEDRCPNEGGSGTYTFVVERISEYGRSTLAKFYILDTNGERLTAYDGYIIEPEGPDEVRSGKNKRIPTGTHSLRWHYRAKERHRYLAIGIYNNKFHEKGLKQKYLSVERWILIHHGGGRQWSEGCLIPARKPYKGVHDSYRKIYMCDIKEDSIKYFKNIKEFIHKQEGTVETEKSHGEKIQKVVMKVLNNIKK